MARQSTLSALLGLWSASAQGFSLGKITANLLWIIPVIDVLIITPIQKRNPHVRCSLVAARLYPLVIINNVIFFFCQLYSVPRLGTSKSPVQHLKYNLPLVSFGEWPGVTMVTQNLYEYAINQLSFDFQVDTSVILQWWELIIYSTCLLTSLFHLSVKLSILCYQYFQCIWVLGCVYKLTVKQ